MKILSFLLFFCFSSLCLVFGITSDETMQMKKQRVSKTPPSHWWTLTVVGLPWYALSSSPGLSVVHQLSARADWSISAMTFGLKTLVCQNLHVKGTCTVSLRVIFQVLDRIYKLEGKLFTPKFAQGLETTVSFPSLPEAHRGFQLVFPSALQVLTIRCFRLFFFFFILLQHECPFFFFHPEHLSFVQIYWDSSNSTIRC